MSNLSQSFRRCKPGRACAHNCCPLYGAARSHAELLHTQSSAFEPAIGSVVLFGRDGVMHHWS
jgi:hypothetical protein